MAEIQAGCCNWSFMFINDVESQPKTITFFFHFAHQEIPYRLHPPQIWGHAPPISGCKQRMCRCNASVGSCCHFCILVPCDAWWKMLHPWGLCPRRFGHVLGIQAWHIRSAWMRHWNHWETASCIKMRIRCLVCFIFQLVSTIQRIAMNQWRFIMSSKGKRVSFRQTMACHQFRRLMELRHPSKRGVQTPFGCINHTNRMVCKHWTILFLSFGAGLATSRTLTFTTCQATIAKLGHRKMFFGWFVLWRVNALFAFCLLSCSLFACLGVCSLLACLFVSLLVFLPFWLLACLLA